MRNPGPVATAAVCVVLLTGCRQPLPFTPSPVSASAVREKSPAGLSDLAAQKKLDAALAQDCSVFMRSRPRDQRAKAVQYRLDQADQMSQTLDPHIVTVDLIGDHADVLSLSFSVKGADWKKYSNTISDIVLSHFSTPEIEDYLCESGFAQVKLTARGPGGQQVHPLWTRRVTSEGLVDPALSGRPVISGTGLELQQRAAAPEHSGHPEPPGN